MKSVGGISSSDGGEGMIATTLLTWTILLLPLSYLLLDFFLRQFAFTIFGVILTITFLVTSTFLSFSEGVDTPAGPSVILVTLGALWWGRIFLLMDLVTVVGDSLLLLILKKVPEQGEDFLGGHLIQTKFWSSVTSL